MVGVPEHLLHEERLRELRLFSLEKAERESHCCFSNRTRGKEQKPQHRKFHRNKRKTFFIVKSNREVEESPLEISCGGLSMQPTAWNLL